MHPRLNLVLERGGLDEAGLEAGVRVADAQEVARVCGAECANAGPGGRGIDCGVCPGSICSGTLAIVDNKEVDEVLGGLKLKAEWS